MSRLQSLGTPGRAALQIDVALFGFVKEKGL
jgi:hypothetical protein